MSLSGYVALGRALPGAVVTWLVTGSGSPGSWRRGRVRAVPARHPAADGLVDRAQHAALLLSARAPDQRSGAGRRTVRHLPTGPFGPRCPAWSPRRTLPGGRIYGLTERLVRWQRAQDHSASPRLKPWALRLGGGCGHPRPQAERVALRKGMIDLRLAELREGYGCATMRILDDRSLIALKLSADYRIARLGSVRFPSRSAARIAAHDTPFRGAYTEDYSLDSLDDRRASW
jgi:hypothetical protein